MSDIFISYASADRERARVLADVLIAEGWSVWWDRVIPPGKQFDEVIEEALDAARCVVVLWSQASAASTWVKTEAAEAMRRKALIPAIIEDAKIPLEFRRLQAADLSRWQGDRADPQLQHFFKSIEAEVQRSHAGAGTSSPARETPPPVQATRPEPPPVSAPEPPAARPVSPPPVERPEPRPKGKLSPVLIAAIAAVVLALIGGGLYYERARSIEAAEKSAREKAAQETAERERERVSREQEARLAAQRRAEDERRARSQAPAERPAPIARAQPAPAPARAPAQPPQAVPATGVMNVQWRDHALGFTGNFAWTPSSAVLRVGIVDLKTGTPIGNYAVPAMVSQTGPTEYIVQAQFAVPGDSTTPGAHTHTSRLFIRAQQDGSWRLTQNCPRQGECY